MIAFLLILAALVVGFRRRLLAFLRRGRDAPLPSSEPASPASRAVQQTTDSGAAADLDVAPDQTIAATVSPPPPTPAPPPSPPQEFQIIGSAEHGYRYVEAESDDGQVTRLHTGMKIRVVTQLEHMSLVKSTSGGPAVWVDRRDIQMVNPEAVNNE
jgi:hypothetical protein